MTGLAINFSPGGPALYTDRLVTGFDATVQNGLVNVGTDEGSDPVFTDRGTTLMRSALDGEIVNLATARHAANFAALDARTFLIATEVDEAEETLADLTLSPVELDYLQLKLEAQFTSDQGRVVGITATLPAI